MFEKFYPAREQTVRVLARAYVRLDAETDDPDFRAMAPRLLGASMAALLDKEFTAHLASWKKTQALFAKTGKQLPIDDGDEMLATWHRGYLEFSEHYGRVLDAVHAQRGATLPAPKPAPIPAPKPAPKAPPSRTPPPIQRAPRSTRV